MGKLAMEYQAHVQNIGNRVGGQTAGPLAKAYAGTCEFAWWEDDTPSNTGPLATVV